MPDDQSADPPHARRDSLGDKVVRRDIQSLVPALRAFARMLTRNAADSDDLVQETLVKALANGHRFTPGTNLKSWLFTIMRNSFYTHATRAKRESPGAADCASLLPTSLPKQEWRVLHAELRSAVEALPDNQREALLLVGALGVSYQQAATICGCEIGTIKSRISRARERLAADLNWSLPTERRRQGYRRQPRHGVLEINAHDRA